MLIAVNPCRKLPYLYDRNMMEQYKRADFGELSPHPFAIADAAYRYLYPLSQILSFFTIIL